MIVPHDDMIARQSYDPADSVDGPVPRGRAVRRPIPALRRANRHHLFVLISGRRRPYSVFVDQRITVNHPSRTSWTLELIRNCSARKRSEHQHNQGEREATRRMTHDGRTVAVRPFPPAVSLRPHDEVQQHNHSTAAVGDERYEGRP